MTTAGVGDDEADYALLIVTHMAFRAVADLVTAKVT